MSTWDSSLSEPLMPFCGSRSDSKKVKDTLSILKLQSHPEGGYFVETDRDPFEIANPFKKDASKLEKVNNDDDTRRAASTSIYYYLTPENSQGNFHRNAGRTVHTLHRGRGRYILIHADKVQQGERALVETFIVGHDIEKGERLQWIVEGGKYKASYLLPDQDQGSSSDGLLISETVVPGFDYRDHDFLDAKSLKVLVTNKQAEEVSWLIRNT